MHPSLAKMIERPIAHRGLHDGNNAIFENTRGAFQAAIDADYGIELDVQLSRDGDAIVFHDDTLDRLTEMTGPVRSQTTAALASTRIGTGNDTAETLDVVLRYVAGRVPIVVELKENGEGNQRLAQDVSRCVNQYNGAVAVMSFSQNLIALLRAEDVTCPVGLTAEGIGTFSLDDHRTALDLGIDFVSYHVHALPNAFVSDVRALGKPVITWTVRNPDQARHSYAYADQITFESYPAALDA